MVSMGRGEVYREQKIVPAKSHHQKCMTFLWDEGLTIKRGAGENNMSGIFLSGWKRARRVGETGVMALLEWQPCVMQPLGRWCKLRGVSTSPCNHETGLCLALIDRFLASASLFSLSGWAVGDRCRATACFHEHLAQGETHCSNAPT